MPLLILMPWAMIQYLSRAVAIIAFGTGVMPTASRCGATPRAPHCTQAVAAVQRAALGRPRLIERGCFDAARLQAHRLLHGALIFTRRRDGNFVRSFCVQVRSASPRARAGKRCAGSCTRRLTGDAYSLQGNADGGCFGIGFIEISAIAGAIEPIVGIPMTRVRA